MYVWEMVKEAVNEIGGTVTIKQIREHIWSKHGNGVKKGTIDRQTLMCTVNRQGRANYSQNKKPRKADGKYDFLFSPESGKVVLYDPKAHGNYEILMQGRNPLIAKDGVPVVHSPVYYGSFRSRNLPVAKDRVPVGTKGHQTNSKKESYFICRTVYDNKQDDKVGMQYEYNNNMSNHENMREGTNMILQRKDGDEYFFTGYGKVANIEKKSKSGDSHVIEYVAKFDNYQTFEPPKPQTLELYQEMKKSRGFNNRYTVFPISKELYNRIIGIKTPHESTPAEIKNYANILRKKHQLIFYGPPGTGKTYNAMLLAKFIVRDNTTKSLTFRSAAIEILKSKNKPMRYTEISKKIIDQGLVHTTGKTPQNTIMAEILRDIQRNESDSIFTKTGKGVYGLNPKYNEYKTKVGSESFDEDKHEFIRSVTFHQSYSYEEFVEGIRPTTKNNRVSYSLEEGIFKQAAKDAENDPSNDYVLVIDEINRGNISKVFGELITLIEGDKRGAHILHLAYSKEIFTVPKNLFIVGTMNTADRSLIQVDTALRRRFVFAEIMPKPDLLANTIQGISLHDLLTKLNQRIAKEGLRNKQIGHSYFMKVSSSEDLQFVFVYEIVPLLQDYFFDDYEKLKEILGNGFVDSKNMVIKSDWQKDTRRFINNLKNSFWP